MTEKSPLDQKLHDLDEAGAIHDYFETVLKSTEQQAEIASRTMRHLFKWSGVRLLWNNENTGGVPIVAVDHVDQVRAFLTEKGFDFLLSKPGATVEGFEAAAIPGDMLDAALSGSLTQKGQIAMLLGGNNKDAVARTELLLKTERAKRANGANGANGADDASRHGQTQNERRLNGSTDHSTNPFVGLRGADGKINPQKMAKVESFIKAAGAKVAAAVAKSAGLRLDGSPIPEQYR
jgi:hypothetical protein